MTDPIDFTFRAMVMLVGYGGASYLWLTGNVFEGAVVFMLTAIWAELALYDNGDTDE